MGVATPPSPRKLDIFLLNIVEVVPCLYDVSLSRYDHFSEPPRAPHLDSHLFLFKYKIFIPGFNISIYLT